MLFNYQVKGLLKECGTVLNGTMNTLNLRSKVAKLVFVSPREIPLYIPEGTKETILERPLRAETAKGPRTTLARSEMAPMGSTLECKLKVIKVPNTNIKEDLLNELLDYGTNCGIGQWRSSGLYGQFEYQLVKD